MTENKKKITCEYQAACKDHNVTDTCPCADKKPVAHNLKAIAALEWLLSAGCFGLDGNATAGGKAIIVLEALQKKHITEANKMVTDEECAEALNIIKDGFNSGVWSDIGHEISVLQIFLSSGYQPNNGMIKNGNKNYKAFERIIDDMNHGLSGNRDAKDHAADIEVIRKALSRPKLDVESLHRDQPSAFDKGYIAAKNRGWNEALDAVKKLMEEN